MNLCYTERNKECCVGFFGFMSKLFKSSNENDKFDTTRSGSERQGKRNTNEDLDDLDFDEMNDVWDELDDM